MGYEKRKEMGQKPDPKVKAEGEQKVPHKSPKMAAKKAAPKKMSSAKKMSTKKM
jgi:hypothetical protein